MKFGIPRLFLLLLLMLFPMTGMAAPVSAPIVPGLNVMAVTAPMVSGQVFAFPLLTAWKSSGITAIESYDTTNGKMLRAELDGSDPPSPVGDDFPLVENTALFVYSAAEATIDLGTVTSCAPLNLTAGFNLAGFACFPSPYLASEFLHSVGLANIFSISRLDGPSGRWRTAAVDGGMVVGDDFPLVAGEGYIIHSSGISGWTSPLPVVTSLNPSQLSTSAASVQIDVAGDRFRTDSMVTIDGADAATTYVSATLLRVTVLPQGVAGSLAVRVKNPDLYHAGGYFLSDPTTLTVNSSPIGLAPATLTVWQGQPNAALTVSIPAPAPAGGTAIGLASSDASLVSIAAQVVIPQGDTSAAVPLTLPDTGSIKAQSVTVTASRAGMTSAQATLSVRPKPTIDLSPLTTLTGLTFTYLLTVNLSDIAPPGGLPVTLTAAPAGIVSVPATVTIPAGASSVQVTVTATTVGSTTITATSLGRGISGNQNSVTVKPIQTMNYGPLISSEVGVQVGTTATAPAGVDATYTPVASAEVGVAVGSVFTGVSPNHGAIDSTALPVTISGYGLNATTGISLYPATGITVGTPSVAPDGLSATILIDISANAPVTDRTVVVTNATGNIMSSRAGTDVFKVTYLPPEIYSIQPLRAMVGQTVSMSITGKNLNWASSVDFTPSTGIVVSNPPTVNANGTGITVTFTIAADASLGSRVVIVTTPGGTSTATASEANSFSVTADAGTTHTALVSAEVGVHVQTADAPASKDVNYGPTVSVPVGVTVGSTITAIAPVSGAIGATGIRVRALGIGLGSATSLSFYPPDGITVHAETFAIGGDGNPEVTIDIAANAPVTTRTVLVALSSGGYALPTEAASNQFRVTLQQPEVNSIQPLRAMVGQTVTITIVGKNLAFASSVDIIPPTGIYVVNPPAVNAAGTIITVTLNVAADAPLGSRVVTVTTPGGVSNVVSETTNTFSVTADLGTTHTPLLSPEVGVMVSPGAASDQVTTTYGQIASTEVGVMVEPEAAPTSQNVDFGPVVSAQVGVAVGGVLTGISPRVMEPGSSVTYEVTGAGLETVTAITVVPSANLTVTAWTPAGDGLSGTVTITADPGAVSGARTMVLMAGGTALMPSAPGIDILLLGYKPVVNSITTTFPASSVQATVGTTYTLTLNGVHLQGVTKVDIIPSTGVTIDNMPTWFSDGTGEHVSVKIIVDAAAPPSDRLVQLTTQYGSSSTTPSTSNTLSIFRPLASIAPEDSDTVGVAANKSPGVVGGGSVTALQWVEFAGLPVRKSEGIAWADFSTPVVRTLDHNATSAERAVLISAAVLQADSRGPPEA